MAVWSTISAECPACHEAWSLDEVHVGLLPGIDFRFYVCPTCSLSVSLPSLAEYRRVQALPEGRTDIGNAFVRFQVRLARRIKEQIPVSRHYLMVPVPPLSEDLRVCPRDGDRLETCESRPSRPTLKCPACGTSTDQTTQRVLFVDVWPKLDSELSEFPEPPLLDS